MATIKLKMEIDTSYNDIDFWLNGKLGFYSQKRTKQYHSFLRLSNCKFNYKRMVKWESL